MATVLQLLKASDDPGADQDLFLKAQILFWLMGATDGHAKNFSVFLMPGGRFHLTPLYDAISAQPSFDAGEFRRAQMKFAMAVGTKRHYALHTIMPRHFFQTAAKAGIAGIRVDTIFREVLRTVPTAIDNTMAILPANFPTRIADSIIGGIRQRCRMVEDHLLAPGIRTKGHDEGPPIETNA